MIILLLLLILILILILNSKEKFTLYYINLEERKDRKREIEEELKKVEFYNFKRFNGIKNKNGHIGCSQSHIECLKNAKKNNLENVIILEDDFEFLIDKNEFHDLLYKINSINYDVFLLSYNTPETSITKIENSFYAKITDSQTASGYIVNNKYYDTLLKNMEEGLKLFIENPEEHRKYAIDQYWKELQVKDSWFCYNKRVGKQRKSFSDIIGGVVDYNL